MTLTNVTVTAAIKAADGTTAQVDGLLTLTPTNALNNGAVTIEKIPLPFPVVNGSCTAVIAATDDTLTTPQGSGYVVLLQLNGCPDDTWIVTVPHATTTTTLAALPRLTAFPVYSDGVDGGAP